MNRNPNTDRSGRRFSDQTVHMVWLRAKQIPRLDSRVWREDRYGAHIRFGDYGRTDLPTGWEIDHIVPVARGGSDDLINLQPLWWLTNRRKGDEYPWSPTAPVATPHLGLLSNWFARR